jgi:serine protease Do
MTTILRQLNQDINGVVETARRSLVRVVDGQRGAGAGTIWHSDGMIITNAHVVGNGRNLRVVMQNGEDLPARVFAYDAALDLAALAVDAHELPITELGDSKRLQPGAWVMAVGHPWGVVGAVTGGTVIGLGAALPDMPLPDREWLAVNLHMRPGHSGGALIDTQGRLLGVNTMISGPDIGLAVPVHVVKQFLKTELRV